MGYKEDIVGLLRNNGPMKQCGLAKEMGVPTQNIHSTLMGLISSGKVKRDGAPWVYWLANSNFELKNEINNKTIKEERREVLPIGININKNKHVDTLSKSIDKVIVATVEYYEIVRSDEYGRLKSWEHCYKKFRDARSLNNKDYDLLSLNLAFYLASWGMYRGSSFLLQKDYRIHIPVIIEIMKSEYNSLFDIKCDKFNQVEMQKLLKLSDFIASYYNKIREQVAGKKVNVKVSDTLITKVLMGTLGCCPAYDRFFKAGISLENGFIQKFGEASMRQLVEYYKYNITKLELVRSEMKVQEFEYPQMKILDMAFWKIGFDAGNAK